MSADDQAPVALVTGAAGGIGSAVCEKLAREGYRVMLSDLPGPAFDEVAARLGAAGHTAAALPCDLSDLDMAERLIGDVIAASGRIDVLVNNAAFHGPRESVLAVPMADWQAIFAVNVFSAAALARAAAIDMARRRSGAIVNVGSVQSRLPVPSYGAYVASKAAIEGMTRAMAVELGDLGIRVNCVAPGVIGTAAYRDSLERLGEGGRAPDFASLLGRSGTPDEVAEAIAFLAGPKASFITGATLAVDGGRAISRRSDPFQSDLTHPVQQEAPDGQNPDQ